MIKQAIIPLAGLGTRLLPLTSIFAKELLPINGKPGLEYIIDECIEAGIKEIIFIISNKKIMIKNYFNNDAFFKKIIKKKKDKRISNEYKKILKYKKMIKFVYQNSPRGTGDAIFKCKKAIKSKYFLLLFCFLSPSEKRNSTIVAISVSFLLTETESELFVCPKNAGIFVLCLKL